MKRAKSRHQSGFIHSVAIGNTAELTWTLRHVAKGIRPRTKISMAIGKSYYDEMNAVCIFGKRVIFASAVAAHSHLLFQPESKWITFSSQEQSHQLDF